MKKGSIVWTDEKLKIAELIPLGKNNEQIAQETGAGLDMVRNIRKAVKAGNTPHGTEKPKVTPTQKGNAQKPAPTVRFAARRMDCEYTPIMIVAQQAAIERWNFPPDMKFEDFIDTALYQLFKDRGITLQGYIVDDEVETK